MLDTFKSIPETFYSRSFYANLIRYGKGFGGRFILLLVLIASLSFFAYGAMAFTALSSFFPELIGNFPAVMINKGKLSINEPMPYVVKMPAFKTKNKTEEKDMGSFVIDTNYEITNLDSLMKKMDNDHTYILVTADKMITRGRSGEIKINDFKSFPDAVITKEKWETIGIWARDFLIPFVAIFFIIGSLIKNFVYVVLGAVVVKVLSLFSNPDFAGAMRLSAAASVPGALVFGFLPGPMGWPCFLIWLAYVIFGLWSYRRDKAVSAYKC